MPNTDVTILEANCKAAIRKLQDAAWNCGTDEFKDAVSETACNRRYDAMVAARADCVSAVDALCATVRQLLEENQRLKQVLEPFTNNGRVFIFHRNVEHGDYFECLFCNREGPRWRDIPHNQKCLIAVAREQL